MFRRRKPPLDEVYLGLRAAALDAVSAGLVSGGMVVDIPASPGFATVVALDDGTTSLYTSTGGGTIGAGEHETVAAATQRLLDVAQHHLGTFAAAPDGALPPQGIVRFHLLGPSGLRRADVPEESFWGEPHPLMPVIAAAQEVLTAMREASPE